MKKLIIFLLCVAVIGGGGFFGYKKYMDNKKKTTVVDVVPVSLMMMPSEWFDYSYSFMDGRITASNAQRVYIDTQKLVKKVYVEEGQQVKKGDPILEYDMTVVELELAQKENAVRITEQNIKMAKKELEKIRSYKPLEDAPKEPEYDFPDYPGNGEEPYSDYEPDISDLQPGINDGMFPGEERPKHIIKDMVKPAFIPEEGKGTLEEPFIINCSQEAEVSKEFMMKLITDKKCAEICVYDDEENYLYKWIIVTTEGGMDIKGMENWKVSDGITIDEYGQASIDTSVKLYGKLSFTNPTGERYKIPDEFLMPDEETTPEEDIPDMPDFPDNGEGYFDNDTPDSEPENNDYIYSRDAIKKMIAEQQSEIKQLEIDLKMANFELETAKKRKQDGKLYAEIDGYVKKIGKASGEEEEMEEEEYEDEYEEPSPDDNAFAVIEGEGGTEVVCDVSELNLDKTAIGSMIELRSWDTGATGMAEVTGIDSTPTSYSGSMWGENPNNSTYRVHAKVIEGGDEFSIGEWVEISFDESGNNTGSSNSVYMPVHYVHREGGDYYIMKADENDKLKKQYIKVGQIFGPYIEVKGGLDSRDKICFPYGKDIKEGVKTRETDTVLEPENADIFY